MDIDAANALTFEEFVDVFGNVVERCPLVAAAVWPQRPFEAVEAVEAAISEFIDALPESGQEGLLRCLPDLAGRGHRRGGLSPESREEQASAGLDALSAAEATRIAQLNEDYKRRFGFPFVLCARANRKEGVVAQLSERCGGERAAERARAIAEVKKICRLRLRALLRTDAPAEASDDRA